MAHLTFAKSTSVLAWSLSFLCSIFTLLNLDCKTREKQQQCWQDVWKNGDNRTRDSTSMTDRQTDMHTIPDPALLDLLHTHTHTCSWPMRWSHWHGWRRVLAEVASSLGEVLSDQKRPSCFHQTSPTNQFIPVGLAAPGCVMAALVLVSYYLIYFQILVLFFI